MAVPVGMKGPEVRFENVSKAYVGGSSVVRAVTLQVAPGSFIALVGASGAGKSTLLKMVNRLVDPSEGAVFVDDERVLAIAPHLLRRRIGYVFQNIGLFPHLSVADNIAIGLRLEGRAENGRIGELLDLVDLPRAFAARMPDALSGGERQRVGVARALALSPGLMLMDEPFGALDPITRDQLGGSFRALHDRLGLTTIMVTHDMAEALLLADRVLVMAAGEVVADATPGELLGGKGGAAADALVAVPRDQAARLRRLERRG